MAFLSITGDGDAIEIVVDSGGGDVVAVVVVGAVVVIVNGSIVDVDIDIVGRVLSAGKTRFSQVCFCLLWCRR